MEALDKLKKRCEAAGLKLESDVGNVEEILEIWTDDTPALVALQIAFPRGRTTRDVEIELLPGLPLVRWFLREPFEEYAYLKVFEASWSRTRRVVECNLVDAASNTLLWTEDSRRLGVVAKALGLEISDPPDPDERLVLPPINGLEVSLGLSSNMHALLSHSFDLGTYEDEAEVQEGISRTLTLRIEGAASSRHDDAVELLGRVGNAVLFQIDLHLGLALTLERERSGSYDPRTARLTDGKDATSLPPVRFEYDREAMGLYWYAKSVSGIPLLQFLTNYQVMEFYFPIYSEAEAQRILRNVLKDPTFDPARDADVARLLSAIKVGAKGRTYGNESEQLEATIRASVTADELRDFLILGGEERYRFYTSDDAKKIVAETVPVRRESDDHRGSVAKRIYAIRNRIVHTKGGFEEREPLLLPFDRETAHLRHDVELAEFLAQKVLIASSRPLRA